MAESAFNIHEGIKNRMDADEFKKQVRSILKQAEGDRKVLKRRLEERDSIGLSPLEKAAYHGQAALAKILLEFGADRRSRHNETGGIAVHKAAEFDKVEVLKVLLENDEDAIMAKDSGGISPLLHAMLKGSRNVFTYILETYSPACFTYSSDSEVHGHKLHPLYYAAAVGCVEGTRGHVMQASQNRWRNGEIMRQLLQHGCTREFNGEHLLIYASRTGNIDTVKNLAQHSEPSKSDLDKARVTAEKKLSETYKKEFKEKFEEVLNYLDEFEKSQNEETSQVDS